MLILFSHAQLIALLKSSMNFEINNQTGRPMTRNDVTQERYSRIETVQREAYQVGQM
jgi:hypothetical protein